MSEVREIEQKSQHNRVLRLYKQFSQYPFGKTLFSYFFSFHCPYFLTLGAYIEDVKPGFAQVSLKQRWIVQNHIGTIHAIAVCNLIEMTMGLVVEASIPSHLRWLPMGMEVKYLKKSAKKVIATSSIDPPTFFKLDAYPGSKTVPIEVKDSEGTLVIKGDIQIWISEKAAKEKSSKVPQDDNKIIKLSAAILVVYLVLFLVKHYMLSDIPAV